MFALTIIFKVNSVIMSFYAIACFPCTYIAHFNLSFNLLAV